MMEIFLANQTTACTIFPQQISCLTCLLESSTFFSSKTSYATSISVLLMFTLNFETCSYHDTITGNAIKTTSLLPSITNSTMTTQINSNVYDLPEPEWITWTLKQYYEYNLLENPMNLPIQFTPNALLIFLSSLAHSSPYPRFSEVVQCAQLTSRRLLTALARYRADCLLLQANLAEIKSNADQMQCQLNQIEANWSVITRAMQVSEGALEVSNCLNQLYSTELAVTIFRQSQNNHLSKHPFSTISSSTSSSSFHGHNKSSQLHHPLSHSHQQHLPSQQTQHHLKRHTSQQMHLIPSSHQPYAIVPLSNSSICSSDEHDVLPITTSATANTIGQQQIPSMNHFNLHTLKSFRQQAEFLAYSILDRYETSDSGGYERILPRSLSNSVNTNIAFQGNTNQNMTSGTSGIGGDNGGGCGWETPDSGAGSSSINEISSQQQQQQLHSQQSQQHPSLLLSSSASSLLFGHYYQTYGGVVSNNPTNNNNIISSKLITHSDLHLFNSVLDNLPPLWTLLSKTSTSFYESDLDSSDSSDAPGNFIKSTDLSTHITHNNGCGQPLPQPPPLPHLHNHNYMQLSNWSRIEERKLRTIYCQLIHTYKRLKSMLIDLPSSDQLLTINDTDGRGVETTSSIGPTTGDDNENCKLSTNGSIQQQELCCVKEECADLKVRVYLLEKELRANRLTLESRAAAERALRAHLDALLTEQNNRQLNSTLEALRSSTEIQQVQSEELVNDLKRANSALITAFDKVKRKYTTRIKKLEEQLNSLQSMQSTCSNSSIGKTVPQTMLNTANIHNTTISTTTTTTTTTSTNNNNHVNNTLDLSKTSSIVNNMHNLNKNIQIHSGIYPNNSSIQQTSTTHSLNRPSFIDYNCELSSIPTSCIPPIPLHHHQPQQQQTTKVNTPQLGTTHQHSSTNLVQSINSKHLPIHH
ncbi:Colorectal mutant cancer protein [Schistosoma japonicum]|nr:Colorectal mutant cancer protein [Schistosoma japonicum]